MQQDIVEITREEMVRIAGEDAVDTAERLSSQSFQNFKWERYAELTHNFAMLCRKQPFEARRSFVLGLDPVMKLLLLRHVFEEQAVE